MSFAARVSDLIVSTAAILGVYLWREGAAINFLGAAVFGIAGTIFYIKTIREQREEELEDMKEEISRRILHLAGVYQIPPDKFAKDLQKRNGLIEIYDQVMNEKVIDFLQLNAKIEEVPAAAAAMPAVEMPATETPASARQY